MKVFTNFSFHMNTEIFFGKQTETKVGEFIRKYGGTKVMLVYGGGSIKRIGLYDTVVSCLKEAGLPFVELGGVQPNPRRSLVEKGIQMAREEKVDFFLGIGGGSSIDTAKAIAIAMVNDGEYWKFYQGAKLEKMGPVGTIHTISAAGSETSGSSVLVDDIESGCKFGFLYPTGRPLFAIMNPELTYSVSPYQTGSGAADILAHTTSRYFSHSASYLGDEYCIGTLRTVVKYGPVAVANPNDYEARAELMLAGSFSHNDVTGLGRSMVNRGGEHALEIQLSGHYDTAHGAGLAAIMPAWLQYIVNHGNSEQIARVAQFGVRVFGADPDMSDVQATANDGLHHFRAWIKSLGMPLTLKELGIPKEDLPNIIKNCNANADGIIKGFMDLDKAAVAEIFTSIVE